MEDYRMTDDWNLRDKIRVFTHAQSWMCDAECDVYLLDDIQKHESMIKNKEYLLNYAEKYYSKNDIETLKKKLIEDLMKLSKHHQEIGYHSEDYEQGLQNSITDAIGIIIKRFGED